MSEPGREYCCDAMARAVDGGHGIIVRDGGSSPDAIDWCPWCGEELGVDHGSLDRETVIGILLRSMPGMGRAVLEEHDTRVLRAVMAILFDRVCREECDRTDPGRN